LLEKEKVLLKLLSNVMFNSHNKNINPLCKKEKKRNI
jgi:hypothetical protein